MAQIVALPKNDFVENWKRRLGQAAWVFLAGAAVFSLARTVGKTADGYQIFDFGTYYRVAGVVARGESPYTIDEYGPTASFVYAPAYAYLLYPLHFLEFGWGSRLWMVGNWISTLACILLALRLVEKRPWTQEVWPKVWLGTLAVCSFFWNNISGGQVGALMIALCLGWAVCQRHGRPFIGGILLALATALKIAPILLVPYLIVRRDWRGLGGFLAGGLALLLVPAPWVGLKGAVGLHFEWARHCQNTQIADQTCRVDNQSLLGELARLPGINLQLLLQIYPLILLILAGVLYAWIIWSPRRERTSDEMQSRDNLHLALLFIFMTLAHPRAWSCNFAGLILACFFLADQVCRRLPGWKVALGALGLVLCACASSKSEIGDFTWMRWFHQGKDFWSALAIAGACCWCYESWRPGSPYSSARMA